MYMVPPFLAYYGVLTGNRTLLQEAYNQVMFYRRYLRDPSANNLWKHIQLGSNGTDSGHWSTGAHLPLPSLRFLHTCAGNGWAAAGMLRVLSTIKQSGFADTMRSQQVDLANWIQEIHDGIYTQLVRDQSRGLDVISDPRLLSTRAGCSTTTPMTRLRSSMPPPPRSLRAPCIASLSCGTCTSTFH